MDNVLVKNKGGAPVQYTYNVLKPVVENWIKYANEQTFEKTIYDQKIGEQKTIKLKKPLTIQSFILYAGISRQTYLDIKNDSEHKVYDKQLVDMFMRIHEYIQDNQIAGAILNEYNAQIVSRINGLTDTVNVNNNISINALPVNIGNNVIDLTDSEFEVINNNDTDMLTELI